MTGFKPTAPIFVVGFARSGTTLLQALLGAHSRIAAPPEMHFGRRILRFADYWGDLNDEDTLYRVVAATLDSPRLAGAGFSVEQAFERARHGPRTYAAVFEAVMADYTERLGKQRWSEKTPHQSCAAIWSHFPDAQVVHIVRDPRPMIVSHLTRLRYWPDMLSTARAWREFTKRNIAAGAQRGETNYLRIRYEDLAADPPGVMRDVFSFLGEDFESEIINDPDRRRATLGGGMSPSLPVRILEPIRANPAGAWRRRVSTVMRIRIEGAVADLLPSLGYPVARQRTVLLGRALNVGFYPALAIRAGTGWLASRARRNPQKRYAAAVSAQRRTLERRRLLQQRNATHRNANR